MVTRARGTLSDRQIDEGWPHQVTVDLPERDGRFARYNGVLDWLRVRGWQPKRKTADNTHACFCFNAVEEASAFQCAFGGALVAIEPLKPKLKAWQW